MIIMVSTARNVLMRIADQAIEIFSKISFNRGVREHYTILGKYTVGKE